MAAQARAAGLRAGDGNAELFTDMLEFVGQLERREFDQVELAFIEDKIANSPAGPAYASSYAWMLAERGDRARARTTLDAAIAHPHAFDANWMSAQAECTEACVTLGDATHAAEKNSGVSMSILACVVRLKVRTVNFPGSEIEVLS